jgi:hypothetical protein
MYNLFNDMKNKGLPLRFAVSGKFKKALIKCAIFLEQSMNYNGALELYAKINDWIDDVHLYYGMTEQIFLVTKQLLSLKSLITQSKIEDMKKIHMMLYNDEPTFFNKYKAYIFPPLE